MLRINAEGIIKNIFIVDNHIYFEDDKGIIVDHPVNRYSEGTDSYEDAETFLYDEAYLNLNDAESIAAFKDYCISQYHNDIYSFIFNGVNITMYYHDDPAAADEEILMMKIKEYCIK